MTQRIILAIEQQNDNFFRHELPQINAAEINQLGVYKSLPQRPLDVAILCNHYNYVQQLIHAGAVVQRQHLQTPGFTMFHYRICPSPLLLAIEQNPPQRNIIALLMQYSDNLLTKQLDLFSKFDSFTAVDRAYLLTHLSWQAILRNDKKLLTTFVTNKFNFDLQQDFINYLHQQPHLCRSSLTHSLDYLTEQQALDMETAENIKSVGPISAVRP